MGTGYHPSAEDRQLVTVMAGMGIPEDQMVLCIRNPATKQPISPVTLRKHYRKELNEGIVNATAKVGLSLFKNATTGNERYPGGIPAAQIFWLKCRGRWQQNPEKNPPPPPEQLPTRENMQDTTRRLLFAWARELATRDRERVQHRQVGEPVKRKVKVA